MCRARFINGLNQQPLKTTSHTRKMGANVRHVGQGMPTLKYLSRYLYRGMISEKNIISNQNGQVTFKYTRSVNLSRDCKKVA